MKNILLFAMLIMMLNDDSKIEFYKLHFYIQPDKHNLYLLARSGSKDTLKVDKKIIEIVGLLTKGKTIKETAKAADYSVDVVKTIIKLLQKSNFIKTIDHNKYENQTFTENSHIQFHRLKYSKEADENDFYAIVRWDTDDSLLVDKKVIDVINLLNNGGTVKQAAIAIGYSTDVVMTILKMLEDAHFFKSIDTIPLEDKVEKIKPWFTNINKKWFSWAVNKLIIYTLLIISLSGTMIGVFLFGLPTYKAYFWHPDLFIVFVTLFVIDSIILFVHESAHFITTKAVGGEALIRISYRYIFTVVETESYHLAVIPKKQRYIVYLAGMFVDFVIVGLVFWILIASIIFKWQLGLLYNLLLAIVLYEFIGIIWQFDAFLETDMYNFLSDYLGIENLKSDALKFIDSHVKKSNKLIFLPVRRMLALFSREEFKNSDDFRMLRKQEKNKVYIYVVILIVGLTFTTLEYIFYTIPRDVTYVYQSLLNSVYAIKHYNFVLFGKSLIIIAVVLFEYLLLVFLKLKEKKK